MNGFFEEIKPRIDNSDDPYPAGWRANAVYLPVELPGYVGDLDGVRNTKAAVAVRGPYIYLRLSIEPAFDSVRQHPRYLALKTDYETWAAN